MWSKIAAIFFFFFFFKTRSSPRPISYKVLLAVRLFKRCNHARGGGGGGTLLHPTLMRTEQNSCHSIVSGPGVVSHMFGSLLLLLRKKFAVFSFVLP